ncbi:MULTISPECIES: hypothetical protein [Dietzia]|uniref:Uncharacterized protein n=1 Tax=Dietzia natronolimnaea TaxID=161920 RepID=A0A2A2WUZ5_9ACTN|nr:MULTISPECIES: hypothetical protein [Dietzia]AVZ39545.1 hypothetical protein CT688_08750 [Dietzia sp. JS16-p6b]EYT63685.1 hypothetical protein H483_0107100 [Dietzia sp. UCD-THP]MBB1025517.1 hypothetical protein [Dietzia sp. DQ12-76]MBB1026110.1 hypothetical protein [Dietzia sp. DQ11-38-2]PAY25011.1 hypothetical protein CEY15_00635 [Dietzia natronolimnaea]
MAPRGRQWFKVVGAAGVVGVAATGILAARTERRRQAYEPDEIRERLHQRYTRLQSRRDGSSG